MGGCGWKHNNNNDNKWGLYALPGVCTVKASIINISFPGKSTSQNFFFFSLLRAALIAAGMRLYSTRTYHACQLGEILLYP